MMENRNLLTIISYDPSKIDNQTWKQQFKPKPCSIHCMIGNVDTRFRQWTFVPYFKQKKPKVANGEVTQDYLGELENIEKRAYYTRDVYILGQFVNVQKVSLHLVSQKVLVMLIN